MLVYQRVPLAPILRAGSWEAKVRFFVFPIGAPVIPCEKILKHPVSPQPKTTTAEGSHKEHKGFSSFDATGMSMEVSN